VKILLVARWPVGGIKTYFRYIYGADIFRDAEISLLAPADELVEFINTQLPLGRITLIPVAGTGKSIKTELKKVLKENTYDIVHSHGFSASFFVQQIMWMRKTSHIMTAHDVFLPDTFNGASGFLKKIAMSWLLSSVTKVLSVSEDARNNIYKYFPRLKSDQVINITNGIDTEFFAKGVARNLRAELNCESHRPLIGFFGRFMAQKGFRQIIDAIEILSRSKQLSVMPLVVTFGWGGFIREDFELIEKKGLLQYFVQLPGTNDMPSAIKAVDLVLMPSRWEACPLLPMEVLSAGKPIIGTDCIGLREVLNGTPAKVVPVNDAFRLAEAIVEALSSDDKDFIDYQEQALERFSATKHAQQLHALYLDLLKISAR
jgi:glycosyltransferase involved in cell wall biosynthesis